MSAAEVFYLAFDNHHQDIRDAVLDNCTPASLFCLKKSTQRARVVVQDYISTAFNIKDHLSYHIDDTQGFRKMQRDFGLIISGSNVVEFLGRTRYPGADLDMYVTAPHMNNVFHFLLAQHKKKYRFIPSDKQKPTLEKTLENFNNAQRCRRNQNSSNMMYTVSTGFKNVVDGQYTSNQILGVFSFESRRVEGRKIQVVVCNADPIATVLLFHSSTFIRRLLFLLILSMSS